MVSLTRYAIALIVVSYSIGLCASTVAQENPVKRAIVTGTVTIKGKPAPDISVAARANDAPGTYDGSFLAKTDKEGNYRVAGIPSGQYYVSPIAPAYVPSNRKRLENTLVIIGAETVEGINFDLVPGGVISGKITDSDGRPLIEQSVFLLNADETTNQRGMTNPANQTQTDDRGIYRIFGIGPGRYKIAAGDLQEDFHMSPGRTAYKQTFYSDPSDPTKPLVIEVGEGSDSPNVNITLDTVQTFKGSGRIVDEETGQPLAGVWPYLQSISERGRSSTFLGPSNSRGEFRFDNIRPGKYGVGIAQQPVTPQQPASDLRSETVTFEIIDQDVGGLVVKASKGGASLSGVVVLENTNEKTVWNKLLQSRLYGYNQKSTSGVNRVNSSPIAPDGSFVFNGVEPGTLFINLTSSDRSLLKGFNIARIERNGSVLGRNIEVKSGEQLTDVRIIVTYGAMTVHGVLRFDNGPLPSGSRAVIRVIKDGANLAGVEADVRGNFIIEGLAPGLYELEASIYTPDTAQIPGHPVRQQVNVSNNGVTDVIINIEKGGPTKP